MKNKSMKSLSRSDLLELLIRQSKEIESLRTQLEEAKDQLLQRELEVRYCGSLADAALRINGVFQAAQAACEQYLYNISTRAENAGPEELEELRKMIRPQAYMDREDPIPVRAGPRETERRRENRIRQTEDIVKEMVKRTDET